MAQILPHVYTHPYISISLLPVCIWLLIANLMRLIIRWPPLHILVYQPVLPHGLIRINIRMRSIIIIIYFTPFSSIKFANTYSKIYIYHYLIIIDFILHHTSTCIRYIFSWTIYLWFVFLSLSSHMNIWWHISWVVFLYKQ